MSVNAGYPRIELGNGWFFKRGVGWKNVNVVCVRGWEI